MPFFAAPKNVVDIILRKRIVLNESNMTELNPDLSSSPSPVGNTLTHIRKPSLVTGLLLASPKNKLTTSPSTANLNQAINLTSVSHSNPFYENNFPLWSFTDTATGCSLIIVPECSHSNKQDECDTIIKNYNALLCDEINKSKKLQAQNLVQIQLHLYAEYEFYKFKVPFDHQKISSSYLKLMEICSYKSIAEYNKENESNSFYLRLHNSKWLKRVSELLQLATKIINCLRFNERNVFLEEFKGSTDCSCILSSLAKICMNRICRTVSGFEDLIQKEWFLVGHMFSKRLETCLVSNSDEFINEAEKARSNSAIDSSVVQANSSSSKSNGQISPTFLLFLDCVFQLIIQYPEEFEFNEIYLIHMWDYSCSGASLGFSFDGVVSWQNYLDSQTFMISSNTPVDSESRTEFSKKLFQANNSFWLSHIQKNRDILFNTKNYEPKSLILTPNDKMYALKFWSRCYLRFCEKFHCYNNEETTINKEHSPLKKLEPTTSNTLLSQRPAPPPPSAKPPTPKLKHLPDQSIKKSPSKSNFNVTISSSGLKITTKVTEDGHITTSF